MSVDLGADVGSSIASWGFLLLLLVLFWAVAMRPARKQRQNMEQLQDGLEVGDEVVTAAGIYGSIHQLADTRVGLEIAPGVVIEMARQAIVRKVDPVAPESDDADNVEAPADAEAGDE